MLGDSEVEEGNAVAQGGRSRAHYEVQGRRIRGQHGTVIGLRGRGNALRR